MFSTNTNSDYKWVLSECTDALFLFAFWNKSSRVVCWQNVRINSSFMSIFESENVIIPASGATLIDLQTHLWTNTLPVPYCVCPAKKQPMQHKLSHSKSLQEDACN